MPTNVSVNTSYFAATVRWEPNYNGGYEQTFHLRYLLLFSLVGNKFSHCLLYSRKNIQQSYKMIKIIIIHRSVSLFFLSDCRIIHNKIDHSYRISDQGDAEWKTIRVSQPETTNTFTLYNLQSDNEYEFQVYATNRLGAGQPSPIIRASTKRMYPMINNQT